MAPHGTETSARARDALTRWIRVRVVAGVLLTYLTLSFAVGDAYPFSTLAMYAESPHEPWASHVLALDERGVAHDLADLVLAFVAAAQLSALTYPFTVRARVAVGTALIAFHLGTLALRPVFYSEATALLLALSYPWPSLLGRAEAILTRLMAPPRDDVLAPPR